MAKGTEIINRGVWEKVNFLEAKRITAEYSYTLAQQNECVHKFKVSALSIKEMSKDISAEHTIFLSKDDELASRRCILPGENIYQKAELPNRCEILAATIVLNYLGFNVDKVTTADKYLPKQYPYYNVDPNEAYMGNPHTGQEWYCLPGQIVTAVNSYLSAAKNTDYVAIDITGVSIEELKDYIKKGSPIIFWATVGFSETKRSYQFKLQNGEYPYTGLHCLVLKGYDEESMYICDPLGITEKIAIDRFTYVFQEMGSRAIVISES